MSLNNLSSRAIIGAYYAALEEYVGASWMDAVSMTFRSDQESETYKWLGMTPAMRAWGTGRLAKGLRDQGITATNQHYEATLEIPVEDIRRDKTDQIMVRVNELARRDVGHWSKLLTTLIENGNATACYDGQYFFDSDHSEGSSGTQRNLILEEQAPGLSVTSSTAPTATEMQSAILDCIVYMMTYKDDQGEPMNADATEFLIMCPPTKIWSSALAAVKNEVINQSTNTLQAADFRLKVVCNPRLTWTADFAIFRTDAPVKPLIRQIETDAVLEAIAEGSELEFQRKVWQFGLDAWRAVQYGYWQYAARCTLDSATG